MAAAASLDETALAAVTHAAAQADSVVETLGLDIDAALLAAAPQHLHHTSSTVHGSGSATASEAEGSCAACLRGLAMMLCLKSLLLGWRWLQQLALHWMRLQSWLLQLRRMPPPQHWLQTWQCLCWAPVRL